MACKLLPTLPHPFDSQKARLYEGGTWRVGGQVEGVTILPVFPDLKCFRQGTYLRHGRLLLRREHSPELLGLQTAPCDVLELEI